VDLLEKLKKTDLAKLPPKKKAEIKAKLLDLREKEIAKNRIAYWKPYAWQKRSVEMIRKKTTTLCIASNKIGKTMLGTAVVYSWIMGFEVWNPTNDDDPDAVEIEGQFFKTSSLGIKPPVSIIIVGEDWKLHLGKTIVRELQKWLPQIYETRKNEQGVEYFWKFPNGSTLTLMCYNQEDSLFESFRAQGCLMDEPPPKSKYGAISRGLFLDAGKVVMTMTPLKEAWILDDLVLSGRPDVGVVDGLDITSNEDLYREEQNRLHVMGLTEAQKQLYWDLLFYEDKTKLQYVSDRGKSADTFLRSVSNNPNLINGLKILRFIKDIDPKDVASRIFGQFKSLVGRVLKQYDRSVHVIKPFAVPTDWPVVAMIDLHLNKQQAIGFYAVDPTERKYVIDEIWEHLSPEEVADEIIRRKQLNCWRLEYAEIDPLAKGDSAYIRNRLGDEARDSFNIIFERLLPHGIILTVSSKDKESGIRNLENWLQGPNRMPQLFFFDSLQSANNQHGHLWEILRWVYDEDGKPVKENDHFMEILYRYSLKGMRYTRPSKLRMDKHVPTRHSAEAWLGC